MSTFDELIPSHEARFIESMDVEHPPDVVYTAFRGTTPEEIPVVRWVTAIRIGLRRNGDMLKRPLIDVLERGGWVRLADEPGREIALGLIGKIWRPGFRPHRIGDRGQFAQFSQRGYAKVALVYRFEPSARGTRLTCEARAITTDRDSARRFRWYRRFARVAVRWAVRSWLSAVKRRAERLPRPTEAAPPPSEAMPTPPSA